MKWVEITDGRLRQHDRMFKVFIWFIPLLGGFNWHFVLLKREKKITYNEEDDERTRIVPRANIQNGSRFLQ